jgi:hypothetical protein
MTHMVLTLPNRRYHLVTDVATAIRLHVEEYESARRNGEDVVVADLDKIGSPLDTGWDRLQLVGPTGMVRVADCGRIVKPAEWSRYRGTFVELPKALASVNNFMMKDRNCG